MRSFLATLTILATLALAPIAQAQSPTGFIEGQYVCDTSKDKYTLNLDMGIGGSLYKSLGYSGFALVTEGWGEFYAGPTLQLGQYLKVGLSLGMEQRPNGKLARRHAASFALVGRNAFFVGAFEADPAAASFQDNTRLWYNLRVGYNLDKLAVGLHARRQMGLGPQVSYVVGPAKTWVSWTPLGQENGAWNPSRFIAGVTFNM